MVTQQETEEFLESLQELSTALALVDPEDPGSFQEALSLLDRFAGHPCVEDDPAVLLILSGIQKKIEESIVSPEIFAQRLSGIEEDLKTIERACEGEDPAQTPQEKQRTVADEPEGFQASTTGGRTDFIQIESDRDLYEDFLLEATESLESIEVKILSLEQDPSNRTVINEIFRPFHTIKGVSGFLNLADMNRLTHGVENLLDQAREGKIAVGRQEIDAALGAVDLLRRLLGCVRARLRGEEEENLRGTVNDFLERIRCRKEPAGEACHEAEASEQIGSRPSETAQKRESALPAVEAGRSTRQSGSEDFKILAQRKVGASTIKVDMHKLDDLANMVGELVIAQSLVQRSERILGGKDHSLTKNMGQLERITSELQNVTMALRMVPLQQTFQKMIRVIRDLTSKSAKSAHLVMSGEDTEIDRSMVDAIYDPLVHMIRNAVDHGIEPPEERRTAGKPESGTIRLKAYHKGGFVHIEMEDDGRGLNRQRVLEKARERGLVGPDEALNDHQIDQLILRPGLSTATTITDISGRGVGMDVVKRAIDALRGKIEIQSRLGRGCTFLLKLPITLAIIDGMVIGIGRDRYVLPTANIKETIRPRREDYFTIEGRGEMIRIRGELLPLIRLHEVLRIKTEKVHPWEALVVVVESDENNQCLLVDEVFEMQDVVIKSMGRGWTIPEGVAGGSILGDGRVGLILDVNGILRLHDGGSEKACIRSPDR